MIRTFNDILDDLMSELVSRTPFTNLNPSAVIRGLLEVIAKVVSDLYGLVKTVMQQSFVQTATGNWLDLKAREMGIIRKPAIKTKVYLTFSSNAPAAQNVTIPAGTICKSQKDSSGRDYRFLTIDEAVMEEGQSSIVVEAEAEQPGNAWNVGQDTISRMVTRVTGINAVTNPEGYMIREGSDPESDEQLRQRAIGKWETLGIGGTREAYRTWALSMPGVIAASVLDDFPFGPGTVGVVILGESGEPSAELINEVYQYIKARKPLTADVRVLAPEIVTINIDLEVTRFASASQETIEADVINAITEYSSMLQLGEGLILARLIDAIMDVDGIYNVKILSPVNDISVGVDHFMTIDQIDIIHRIKGRSYQDGSIDGSGGDESAAAAQILDVNKETFSIE
ncbi:baseplate J/gp47 family protein [bacterium]|nr:baseplate J/gp47 family protein [bacterium]